MFPNTVDDSLPSDRRGLHGIARLSSGRPTAIFEREGHAGESAIYYSWDESPVYHGGFEHLRETFVFGGYA